MSPQKISEILFKFFSEEGYSVNGFKIKSKSPMIANCFYEQDQVSIRFSENKPRAEIKRLITFYAYIEELVFRNDGGTVRLKNFPDINFGYEQSLLSIFFDNNYGSNIFLMNDIEENYSDPKHKKIAERCLQYGTEWATIVSQSGGFCGIGPAQKKELRRQCYNFVVENVKKDVEKEYGSVILTYLLVFIVIPAIARFIITKLLEKYF